MTEVPPDIAEYLASPDTLPEWVRFYRAYPTVTAAVQAVGNGESVAVFTSEHTAYGQQVILIDGKPVIEVVLYPNSQAREALVTAYLNHSDPETATAAILHALPHLLPEDIDLTGIDCVVEPGNGLAPRFGFRRRVFAAGLHTWRDYDELHPLGELYQVLSWHSTGHNIAEGTEAVSILRSHGLPAVGCEACGEPLTNRHPAWPGTWVCLAEEYGPRCDAFDDPFRELHELDAAGIGGPHDPSTSDLEPVT
ncbi:hypothetical protein [Streptomyces subrutilus]|uniref:Uncharacterized protein n=1 Tax=Streptomyces subrutilus TaxID=36818 RepID=A0A1E5P0N9_9ACTN|nr:hypothetical protein [Streptomyces subrutilus]OEJ22600.1 hypothetical protein BGK67_34410 [Streptomyces subrutilus]